MNFWANLVTVIVSGIQTFVTNVILTKLLVLTAVSVFLFFVLPQIITFLVPSSILSSVDNIWNLIPTYYLYWLSILHVDYAFQVLVPCYAVRFVIKRL